MSDEGYTFTGYCERNIDDKYRLAIPSRFRTQFEEAQGAGKSIRIYYDMNYKKIMLYTRDDWSRYAQPILDAIEDPDLKDEVVEEVYRHVDDQRMDVQGRILLDKAFLKELGIEKNISFNGSGHGVAIRPVAKADEPRKEISEEGRSIVKRISF